MSTSEFWKIIESIGDIYGSRLWNIQEKALNMWYECLKDLRADVLREAVINYAKKNEYPPTVAALRKEYRDAAETEKDYRAELKRIYDITVSVYPSAKDNDLTRKLYADCLEKVTRKSRLEFARNFLQKTCLFVKNCENSGCSTIPDFTQFLREDMGK